MENVVKAGTGHHTGNRIAKETQNLIKFKRRKRHRSFRMRSKSVSFRNSNHRGNLRLSKERSVIGRYRFRNLEFGRRIQGKKLEEAEFLSLEETIHLAACVISNWDSQLKHSIQQKIQQKTLYPFRTNFVVGEFKLVCKSSLQALKRIDCSSDEKELRISQEAAC